MALGCCFGVMAILLAETLIGLAFHQQAADELGSHHISGAGKEDWGRAGRYWVVVVALGVALWRCDDGDDKRWQLGYKGLCVAVSRGMSEEQLTALLAKLKDDAGLQEKFSAADLDAAVTIAQEAGFNVSKADLLKHQAKLQTLELSEGELEEAAGGFPSLQCYQSACTPMCVV